MSEHDRVAVVVVHGIADQRPGQTVREIVRLLCHGGAGAPRYAQGEMHDVLVFAFTVLANPATGASSWFRTVREP